MTDWQIQELRDELAECSESLEASMQDNAALRAELQRKTEANALMQATVAKAISDRDLAKSECEQQTALAAQNFKLEREARAELQAATEERTHESEHLADALRACELHNAEIVALRAELQAAQEFVPCNICSGTGMVEVYPPYPDGTDKASCSMCLGDGVKPHKAFAVAQEQKRVAQDTVKTLADAMDKAQAQVATLKAVIAQVEWVGDNNGRLICPWCESTVKYKTNKESGIVQVKEHADDCPRQLALERRRAMTDTRGERKQMASVTYRKSDFQFVDDMPEVTQMERDLEASRKRIAQLEAERDASESRVRVLEAQLSDAQRRIGNQREANRKLIEDAHRRKAQVNKMQRERDALRGDVRKSDYVVALDFRIAALEAQVEAAHRAIDSIGLSRCADAHAGVYPDGRITCDDGRPPLSLVDRVEWLIRWLSDDPYPMGPRIKELEQENAALQAQVVALKADNDVFSRYVRDLMALVAHDDRCVVCEHGGHCSEREALEKDDWKSFGEVMQIYQRRSALATEVKA